MTQNAEFSEQPKQYEIHYHDGITQLELHDNIRYDVDDQGELHWFADIYFITVGKTNNLEDRVVQNFNKYLEIAKKNDAKAQEQEMIKSTRLNIDNITEILVDQEFRLCLLEMGVNV